jgi:2Fe-2S ferredoxin
MTKVTYLGHDGVRTEVSAEDGQSVMQAAVRNNVDGIIGWCGGGAMCGTCHVYIDREDSARVPPRHEIEEELLQGVPSPVTDESRLGCQILLGPEHEGMIIRMPQEQE